MEWSLALEWSRALEWSDILEWEFGVNLVEPGSGKCLTVNYTIASFIGNDRPQQGSHCFAMNYLFTGWPRNEK